MFYLPVFFEVPSMRLWKDLKAATRISLGSALDVTVTEQLR